MTLGMLFREGKETLRKAGVGEWELDAWYLLEEVTGITRSRYYLDQECSVEEADEHRYRELLQKRSRHIPLRRPRLNLFPQSRLSPPLRYHLRLLWPSPRPTRCCPR